MALSTKTFTQLVSGQATAVQARAAGLVDYSIGSILRAVAEAVAGVALFLQNLIIQLLALTRAATSSGADLDSWVADFGAAYPGVEENSFARLGAAGATGLVTFGRFTTGVARTIPIGARVQTADGNQVYEVIADLTNGAYNAGLGYYPLAAGAASLNATVQAVTAGIGGNALAGQITTLSTAITGIDYVTNPSAFTNGQAQETDTSLRTRFRAFILSLREATVAALLYHVGKIQAGLTVTILENVDVNGAERRGSVRITVDDGSGNPPQELVDQAVIAADAHRAAGIETIVAEPTIVTANVVAAFDIVDDGTIDLAAIETAWETEVAAYINSLPIGQNVVRHRLISILYDIAPTARAFTVITVNGFATDLIINGVAGQVAKAGTVAATATLVTDT